MLKLEFIQALAAIAETGSITGAARRLGISKSVVSERLRELERTLGAKLVHRTTRRLSLTDDGSAFYERAKRILREVDGAASELAQRRGTLTGPLRISAPVSFGSLHLGPVLFTFLAQHPDIELTLELDDRFVNILAEGDVYKRQPGDRVVVVTTDKHTHRFAVTAIGAGLIEGKADSIPVDQIASLERRQFNRARTVALVCGVVLVVAGGIVYIAAHAAPAFAL